jgi:hypothetical protein
MQQHYWCRRMVSHGMSCGPFTQIRQPPTLTRADDGPRRAHRDNEAKGNAVCYHARYSGPKWPLAACPLRSASI